MIKFKMQFKNESCELLVHWRFPRWMKGLCQELGTDCHLWQSDYPAVLESLGGVLKSDPTSDSIVLFRDVNTHMGNEMWPGGVWLVGMAFPLPRLLQGTAAARLLSPIMLVISEPDGGHQRGMEPSDSLTGFGETMEQNFQLASKWFWQTLRWLRRRKQYSIHNVYNGCGMQPTSTYTIKYM